MNSWRFHHLGIAVSDIEAALPFYERALGYRICDGPHHDPVQRVHVAFLRREQEIVRGLQGNEVVSALGPMLELIRPAALDSPVAKYLEKEVGVYHTCYEVDDILAALAVCRSEGCLVVANPVSAKAFGGRQIAWVLSPSRQLIELLASD